MKKLLIIIGIIAVAIGVGLGAQNSLPGDMLHSVKVGITENIGKLFAFSQAGKISRSETREIRRLSEDEQLSIANRMTSDSAKKIQDEFKKQTASLTSAVGSGETQKELQITAEKNAEFEGKLHAHIDILNFLQAQKTEQAESLTPIIDEVRSAINSATQARIQAETKILGGERTETEARDDADSAQKIAETVLTDAKQILDTQAPTDEASRAEAEAQLHSAQDHMADGKTRFDAKSYGGAFVSFQQALRSAQEVSERVSTLKSLNISLSQ